MARQEEHHEKIAALGQPPGNGSVADPDFSAEHDRTAVDQEIITDEDRDEREEESPRGWSGEES